MTDKASAAPSEREQFERYVKAYTGRDMEYHERNGTTGLEFGWTCWQVARAHPTPPAADQEPFGYFRAEPFGWTDCAEADEGAVALYERPTQPAVVEPRMPVGNATLERLREWERDGELLERVWGTLVDQETEIGQLRAAARAPADSVLDAMRYRWLRHGDNDEKVLKTYTSRPSKPGEPTMFLPRNDELDRLIDAARASHGDVTEVLGIPDQCPYSGPSSHRDVWLAGWYAARKQARRKP